MMNALLFLPLLVFAMALPVTPALSQDPKARSQPKVEADNTRANKADRQSGQPTAQDQSQAKQDRELAAAVRKAIVGDKSLSTYAHNVKVIARDGGVTLRGPVRSNEEKSKIADLARQVPEVRNVDNRITIKQTKTTERSKP